MSRSPKDWRTGAGHSLAEVAIRAGITGRNPSKTYSRYEAGEHPCPAAVIEAVRAMSDGAVDAEAWHRVRLAFLNREGAAA